MKYGISTCSIDRMDLRVDRQLETFREAGFSILEMDSYIDSSFPHHSPGFIDELKVKVEELGIAIHSIHAPFHHAISHPDRDERRLGIDAILELMKNCTPLVKKRESADEADPGRGSVGGGESAGLKTGATGGAAGVPCLVIHPGHHLTTTPAKEQFGHCLESLREILDSPYAPNYHICIENMLSSHFGAKSSELLSLVRKLSDEGKRISICLDTSHCVYDSNPEEFLEDVFDHLGTTHISDNYHQSAGEFHAIPMTLKHSRTNWANFFRRLSQRLDTIIFELNKPYFLNNDIYLGMAGFCVKQIERYLD